MTAGRPRLAHPRSIYVLAQEFYWDFDALAKGRDRWWFDTKKHDQLLQGLGEMEFLDDEDRVRIQALADEEIQAGRLDASKKSEWIRQTENSERSMRRFEYRENADEQSTREIKVPGEPDVLKELLSANTGQRIREICKDAFTRRKIEVRPGINKEVEIFRNWPISAGSVLPMYLCRFANEFIEAKLDPRFPSSDRRSSRAKQLWFLSRALAGAVFGVSTRTAINLVGALKPEDIFELTRYGKPSRTRTRRKRK